MNGRRFKRTTRYTRRQRRLAIAGCLAMPAGRWMVDRLTMLIGSRETVPWYWRTEQAGDRRRRIEHERRSLRV